MVLLESELRTACPEQNPKPSFFTSVLLTSQMDYLVGVDPVAVPPVAVRKWITVSDPTSIPLGVFNFKAKEKIAFELPAIVPATALKVRVLAFLRTGHEGPSRSFTVRLSTLLAEGGEHTEFIMGARYAQAAISYSSPSFKFPIGSARMVFVQCDDIQEENCHGLQLFVTGWK